MTEQEYIRTRELGLVTAAINALSETTPPSCITKKKHEEIMAKLHEWQRNIFYKTSVTNR